MKNRLIVASCVIFGITVLHFTGVIQAVAWFLLVGAVPGTSYSLPPNVMVAVLVLVLISSLIGIKLISIEQQKSEQKMLEIELRRQRIPRRRYTRTHITA